MYSENPKFGPAFFQAGEIIFRQGDIPDKFYIITDGEVDILYRAPGGEEKVINRLTTGEYFGEIGLVKSSRRAATVRARTAVSVMAMGHQTFSDWLNSSALSREEIGEIIAQRVSNVSELEYVDTAVTEEPDVAPDAEAVGQAVQQQLERGNWESGLRVYRDGDAITRQGELADQFYILVEGVVSVVKRDEDGVETVITTLESGSYFGEMGLVERRQRNATVRAVGDVRVVAFDRDTFSSWMSKSPLSQDEIMLTAKERGGKS